MARILVAEDDEDMRSLIARVLREHVLNLVSSYDEAVRLIRASADGWDVAVLDGAIPLQREGELLAGFLRKRFPGIKIVSCSSAPQSWGDRNIRKSSDEVVKALPAVVNEVLSRS